MLGELVFKIGWNVDKPVSGNLIAHINIVIFHYMAMWYMKMQDYESSNGRDPRIRPRDSLCVSCRAPKLLLGNTSKHVETYWLVVLQSSKGGHRMFT